MIQPETYLQRVSKTADHLRLKLSGEETKKEIGRIPGQTRVSSFMRDKKGKKSGEGEEGNMWDHI